MYKVSLYPVVPRVRKMFDGVKRCTLPSQVMSIAEMFRRFVRREPLPAEKHGIYVESDYDLEKVAAMDRVDQDLVLSEMREKTMAAEAKVKKAQKAKAEKEAADLKARDEKAEADMRARIEKQSDPKSLTAKPPLEQDR